jgi:hypothetical protein
MKTDAIPEPFLKYLSGSHIKCALPPGPPDESSQREMHLSKALLQSPFIAPGI